MRRDIIDLVRKRAPFQLRMRGVDKNDLQYLADKKGVSMSEIISRLIEDEMKRNGYPRSEEMYLEALLEKAKAK